MTVLIGLVASVRRWVCASDADIMPHCMNDSARVQVMATNIYPMAAPSLYRSNKLRRLCTKMLEFSQQIAPATPTKVKHKYHGGYIPEYLNAGSTDMTATALHVKDKRLVDRGTSETGR